MGRRHDEEVDDGGDGGKRWEDIGDDGHELAALVSEQVGYLFDRMDGDGFRATRSPMANQRPAAPGPGLDSRAIVTGSNEGPRTPGDAPAGRVVATLRQRRMSVRLGVPADVLAAALHRHQVVSRQARGSTKAEKRADAARRLGVEVDALRAFRTVVGGGQIDGSDADIRRTIIRLARVTGSPETLSVVATPGTEPSRRPDAIAEIRYRLTKDRSAPDIGRRTDETKRLGFPDLSVAAEFARMSKSEFTAAGGVDLLDAPSPAPLPAHVAPPSMTTDEEIASALGLTRQELNLVRERRNRARRLAKGVPARDVPVAIARSLALSLGAYEALIAALSSTGFPAPTAMAKMAARTVVAGPGVRVSVLEDMARVRAQRNQGASSSRATRDRGDRLPATSAAVRDGLHLLGRGAGSSGQKLTERSFFVADFSQVVHVDRHCVGLLRAFKAANQPDSRVFTVKLPQAHCAAKVACKKCTSGSMEQKVNFTIAQLHGSGRRRRGR